ncbi:MAG: hypothetical protein VX529_11765 [Pseudomonadota bacterium]|nr:hypothetical protein [Pseudomonadota bacterium]
MSAAAQVQALRQKQAELSARFADAVKLRDEYDAVADRARRDLDSVNAQLAGVDLGQRFGAEVSAAAAPAEQPAEDLAE